MITLINDFSHKAWVYFLTEKSEAFISFKNFKSLVEKAIGSNIIGLCTDSGGEFTSNKFTNFCRENGIRRQLMTAYTLQ